MSIAVLIAGILLVVSGLALVVYQIVVKPPDPGLAASPVHASKFSVSSPYPGLVIIGIGVILMLIVVIRG